MCDYDVPGHLGGRGFGVFISLGFLVPEPPDGSQASYVSHVNRRIPFLAGSIV